MTSSATPSAVATSGTAPESPPGFGRAFALTWLAYATYYLGRKGFSVSKKLIESQLHVSMATLGIIDTAYLGAYAVGQFLCGAIGDRVGPRRLVGAGLFASAMACLAFGQGITSAM